MRDLEINVKDASISIISSYVIASFIWIAIIDSKSDLNILELISNYLYLLLIMIVPIVIELVMFYLVNRFAFGFYVTIIIYIIISSLFFLITELDLKFLLFKIPCFCLILFLLIRNKKSILNNESLDSDYF